MRRFLVCTLLAGTGVSLPGQGSYTANIVSVPCLCAWRECNNAGQIVSTVPVFVTDSGMIIGLALRYQSSPTRWVVRQGQ